RSQGVSSCCSLSALASMALSGPPVHIGRERLGGYRLRVVAAAVEPQQAGERLPQLAPLNYHVDHAVLQHELGRLEAGRQLLAHDLLDQALAGEADIGSRLGDDDVGDRGVGGSDAA